MPNQVGDIKTFKVTGTPPVDPKPVYVYKWWDGSIIVTGTENGSVQKRLNIGGNPAELVGPPYVVPYRCEICDELGNVVQVLTDAVAVNNPPSIVGAPSVTPNNQAFPFAPSIQMNAYDLEDNMSHLAHPGVAGYFWYQGTNAIGGFGTTTGPVSTTGTYYGTFVGNRDMWTNTFTPVVFGDGTVYTCKVVDADSGTRSINVPVQGFDPQAPLFSVAAQPDTLTADASTLPAQFIAPGRRVIFTAFAFDTTPGDLVFTWHLWGTNGWNGANIPVGGVVNHGLLTQIQRGWKNDFTWPVNQEQGDGQRVAVVSATNTATGLTNFTSIPVQLIQNLPPVMQSIGLYDVSGHAVTEITKLTLPQRTVVKFSGTGVDANNDVIYFEWNLTPPVAPTSLTLYGRDAYVDVSDWPGSTDGVTYDLLGVCTAVDRFGVASTPLDVPSIVVKT